MTDIDKKFKEVLCIQIRAGAKKMAVYPNDLN